MNNLYGIEMKFMLDKIVFHKDTFTIARVFSQTKEIKNLLNPIYKNISIKGNMPELKRSVTYRCIIEKTETNSYGTTLTVSSVFPNDFSSGTMTTDKQMLDFIKIFIGEGTAKKLEDMEGLCEIVKSENVEELCKAKGIGTKIAKKIINQYNSDVVNVKYLLALKKLGFSDLEMEKLKVQYNNNLMLALDQVKRNIFKLMDYGFRLNRLDEIFLNKLKGNKNDKERIKCYIYKSFTDALYESNKSFIEIDTFMDMDIVYNIINSTTKEFFKDCIDSLVKDKKLYLVDDKYITINHIYNTDVNLYRQLSRLIGENNSAKVDFDIDKEIDYEENRLGVKLNSDQRNAIKSSIGSNVTLLLGSAGTGKTFSSKILLNILERKYEPFTVALCSLSGKASKVLAESTGREASTIHRLLKFSKGSFVHNKNNPLQGIDMVLIDEISMCDNKTLDALLQAIPTNTRVMMMGDYAQLQSVGLSNTCSDILSFPNVNYCQLNTVVRQALSSGILSTCNDVRNDNNPFEDIETKTYGKLQDMHVRIGEDLYDEMINDYCDNFDVNNKLNYTILATTKKMTSQINIDIQNGLIRRGKLKKSKEFIEIFTDIKNDKGKKEKVKIYVGDVIMITKNNYHAYSELQYLEGEEGDLSIFNGNICEVVEIYRDAIKVSIDDEYFIIGCESFDSIAMGYSYNVTKSQGSTIPYCYIYVEDSWVNRELLFKNEALYTAISRGKTQVKMYVEKYRVLTRSIKNRETNNRCTILELILKGKINV